MAEISSLYLAEESSFARSLKPARAKKRVGMSTAWAQADTPIASTRPLTAPIFPARKGVESARSREMRFQASFLRCCDYIRSRLCTPCVACIIIHSEIIVSIHCTRVLCILYSFRREGVSGSELLDYRNIHSFSIRDIQYLTRLKRSKTSVQFVYRICIEHAPHQLVSNLGRSSMLQLPG